MPGFICGVSMLPPNRSGTRELRTSPPAGATPARRQVLSFQPLWIPALLFSGEYERAANENVTVGVGASYWTVDELSLTSFDATARFYPNAALRGFIDFYLTDAGLGSADEVGYVELTGTQATETREAWDAATGVGR